MSNTGEPRNDADPLDLGAPGFGENDRKDVLASRASARNRLELEIASQVDLMHSNLPWTNPGDVHTLIAAMSSEDPAVAAFTKLLTRYNALAPIHILPLEILCNIFFFVVHDPRRRPARANRRLLCTSAVCTFWRRAILSDPLLWTRIDLLSTNHSFLALERSQNVPIDVTLVCEDMRPIPSNWTTLLDHAARIATLTCTAASHIIEALLEDFPSSLPLMHTLSLENPELNFEPEFRETYYLYRDTSIAHTVTPALRKLTLEGVSLPWTLPLFHGLSYLHVQFDGVPFFFRFQVFYDVIKACPALETLSLHNVGPDPHDPDSVIPPMPISLPKLRHLDLYCSANRAFECITLILRTISNIQLTAIVTVTSFRSLYNAGELSFSSFGNDDGQLGITFDVNPYMSHMLTHLPPVRTATYCAVPVRPPQQIADNLREVLAHLDMHQLKTLVLESVPLGAAIEALSSRGTGALKELRMKYVPRDGTEEEMDGHQETLTRLVADVEVHFT
ncbi:hypothetical protein DENSPDRAFT_834647 [Dentipellis sp. KUC8613]|nr:hypothetical protein DENSPDRAFT_834647 [Dentipellis sp. KUC8613]